MSPEVYPRYASTAVGNRGRLVCGVRPLASLAKPMPEEAERHAGPDPAIVANLMFRIIEARAPRIRHTLEPAIEQLTI